MNQSKRLLALDVMRGITIAGMILVNSPGMWSYRYAPLRHSNWDGLTPTDLVFPFFIFIMGISMFFSLRKYQFKPTVESVTKILKRSVLIFLVGLGLNLFWGLLEPEGDVLENLRVFGVLQRLAITYGVGSIILLIVNHKYILHIAAAILLGYWGLLEFMDSMILSETNIIAVVDRVLIGEAHMYKSTLADGSVIAFDPEGLLSSIGSIGQVLIGVFAGKLIAESQGGKEVIIRNLFILGTITLFVGFMLSYACPINKQLWSSTYVLVSTGLASLLLAMLVWIIDMKGRVKWSRFFESFGVNPLYLYVQALILEFCIFKIMGISEFLSANIFQPLFGDYGGSLAYAIFFVLLNWIPGYILYKKRIYIKL